MFYILDSVNGGSTAVEGSVLYIDSSELVVIDHASGYTNAVINLAEGQMVVRDEEEQDDDEDEECPGCPECESDYEDDVEEAEEDNDDEDDEDDDDREDDE